MASSVAPTLPISRERLLWSEVRFAHSEGSEQCWLALESKSQKMEIELRSSMVMQSLELSSGKNHCNQETDTQS